jgi:hypothetical protein
MGQGKGNLGGKFSPWGHQIDLEAKAAPLADPLDLFKGEGRARVCSYPNRSRRSNCCPPHFSLATTRRRSPAVEILHHKHHTVVLLIQSISPSYLLDQGGRRRRYAVRVHLSEASPLAALDRIGSQGGEGKYDYIIHVLFPLCDFFKGMKISSISLVDYISYIRSWLACSHP